MSDIFTPDFLIGIVVGLAFGWCIAEIVRWVRRK